MRNFNFLVVCLMLVFLSCSKDDNLTEETQQPSETQGYNMLLIGNSFFIPYAKKFDEMAINAGFVSHTSIRIARGGENGWAINFWNDSSSQEHLNIKAALDQGNIDIFGMTAGSDPDDRIAGHRAWIEYALQSNPDINIFISIPQIDFPETWASHAQSNGFNTIQEYYDYAVNNIVHDSMVDPLRAEFPNTNIFTVPTGWASFELAQMKLDNELLDNIDWVGPAATSLFTDQMGHQGNIIVETGSLVWLNSIYNVDLITNDYETGFNTDLHEIAKQIMDNHNPNYKL